LCASVGLIKSALILLMHGADMKKAQNILDLPEDGQEV
jgi:hypothetical protein